MSSFTQTHIFVLAVVVRQVSRSNGIPFKGWIFIVVFFSSFSLSAVTRKVRCYQTADGAKTIKLTLFVNGTRGHEWNTTSFSLDFLSPLSLAVSSCAAAPAVNGACWKVLTQTSWKSKSISKQRILAAQKKSTNFSENPAIRIPKSTNPAEKQPS